MAELKVALELANDKLTPLKEVEGQLKVEHKYVGDVSYTMVLDEAIRGKYLTENGKLPAAPAGKEIEEEKIKFEPDLVKYPFYEARSRVYKEQLFTRSDKKFAIGERKLTIQDKKEIKEKQKTEARNILLDKWSRRNAKAAAASKSS